MVRVSIPGSRYSQCKLTRHQETTRKLFSVGPESYFVILLYSETNGVFSAGTKFVLSIPTVDL